MMDSMRFNHATIAVSDLPRSEDFYRRLGLTQIVGKHPHYARFAFPEGDSTLSLYSDGPPVASSTTMLFFECDDLDERVEMLKGEGIGFFEEPNDKPFGWREAYLADPDGHIICLYCAGEYRLLPPWRLGPDGEPMAPQPGVDIVP